MKKLPLNKYVTAFVPKLNHALQGILCSDSPPRIRTSDDQEHEVSLPVTRVKNPPKLKRVNNTKGSWTMQMPTVGTPSVVNATGSQICGDFYNNDRTGLTNGADAHLTSRGPSMLSELRAQLKFLKSIRVDNLTVDDYRARLAAVEREIALAEYWVIDSK